MTSPAAGGATVSVAQVEYALRRMRPGCLLVSAQEQLCRVALTMPASPSGRRNAAEKVVGYLAAAGLVLDAPDPVGALTEAGTVLTVLTAR